MRIEHTDDGGIVVHDRYPPGTVFLKTKTKSARRLAALRVHESALRRCKETFDVINGVSLDDHVSTMTIIGIATLYFRCFTSGRSQLNPANIFKGRPDILECHEWWETVRNQYIAHSGGRGVHSVTAYAVINGKFLEVFSTLVDLLPTNQPEAYQLLFQLIDFVQQKLNEIIENTVRKIEDEYAVLSSEERAALVPLSVISDSDW